MGYPGSFGTAKGDWGLILGTRKRIRGQFECGGGGVWGRLRSWGKLGGERGGGWLGGDSEGGVGRWRRSLREPEEEPRDG